MMKLAQRFSSPESRLHRVVMAVDIKDIPSEIDRDNETSWLSALDKLLDLIVRVSDGEARDSIRCWSSGVRVGFCEDEAVPAVNSAIRLQETLSASEPSHESTEEGRTPLLVSIGIASGEIARIELPGSGIEDIGAVVDRAQGLSAAAAAHAIIVDRATLALLRNGGFSSRAGDAQIPRRTADEYEGPSGKVRLARFADEIEYREIFWNTTLYGTMAAAPPAPPPAEAREATATFPEMATVERCSGSVRRWSRDRGQGLIVSNQGESFYVDRRYIVGATPLEPGTRVFFVPRPSLIPGKNRVAACVVGLGAILSGTVVRVGSRGFGFLEVSDSTGICQRLFMLLGDSHERFTVSDPVSFVVAENDRGPIARNPRRSESAHRPRHFTPRSQQRRSPSTAPTSVVEPSDNP